MPSDLDRRKFDLKVHGDRSDLAKLNIGEEMLAVSIETEWPSAGWQWFQIGVAQLRTRSPIALSSWR
jgi:hypothetical protein